MLNVGTVIYVAGIALAKDLRGPQDLTVGHELAPIVNIH